MVSLQNKPSSSKTGKIIVASVVALIIIAFLFFQSKSTVGTKSIVGATTTEYRNENFAYRFVYPNSWKAARSTLAAGYIELKAPSDKPHSLHFWYKDSPTMKNMAELKAFVEDDMNYAETEQGYRDVEIFTDRVADYDVVVADATDPDGKRGRMYYVPDFSPAEGQGIVIWTIELRSNPESFAAALADKEIQGILASFRLLHD